MQRNLITLGLCAAVLAVSWIYFSHSSYLKQFDYLQEPQIVTLPNQRMLAVESTGDPSISGWLAMSQLFRAFGSLKRQFRGVKMRISAPRVRWLTPLDTPKEQRVGIYALPVPDRIRVLPLKLRNSSTLKLQIWEYGPVAEILHVGPYAEEGPTLSKLRRCVAANGFAIAGPQEEVYLKGPGLFLKGDPRRYKTIIRYPIQKIQPARKPVPTK